MTATRAYKEGYRDAEQLFGVKVAFLGALAGMAGSMLGGTAARAGVGALARRAGGGVLGRAAGAIGKSRAGNFAVDMAGSQIGGGLVSRMTGGSHVQQPPPMGA